MKKKILALTLALILAFTVAPLSAAQDIYKIDKPYNYPLTPATVSEWAALHTMPDKINVCQIPKDILSAMTTDALAETVLNYPLIASIFAFDNYTMGYESVLSYFNGLQELSQRKDAVSSLQKLATSKAKTDSYHLQVEEKAVFSDLVLRTLISEMQKQSPLLTKISSSQISSRGLVYITTPNGTDVSYFTDLDFANPTERAVVQAAFEALLLQHPRAILLSGISAQWNCHNWTWNYNNATNGWMAAPHPFWTDGSYIEDGNFVIGRIVVYFTSSTSFTSYTHSGNLVNNNGSVWVESKWGQGGLMKHDLFDCPYFVSTVSYRFFKKA